MSERNDRDPLRQADRTPIATRAALPTPRRLSRKALATLAGVSALGIAAALGYGLSTRPSHHAPPQSVSVDHHSGAEVLEEAPKDYSDLARAASGGIGPPGDIAEPISASPSDTGASAPPEPTNSAVAAEQQRHRQQRDSARASKLFAGTNGSARARPAPEEDSPSSLAGHSTEQLPPSGHGDAQDRKAAFVTGGAREPTVNSGSVTPPAGRYVVTAGSTIAAALITGLSSDLPGEVVAQVTENIFDSVTGRTLLIPQGARLIGSYDAHLSYGQNRALVVWTRLILPDGRSIALDRMIGTDPSGQSGFSGRVDHHTGSLIKTALLSALFGLGPHLATGGGDHNDIAFAIRDSAGQSVERAGDKLVGHQLDVQPTITIRPGARVRVLVGRDLVLAPWNGG